METYYNLAWDRLTTLIQRNNKYSIGCGCDECGISSRIINDIKSALFYLKIQKSYLDREILINAIEQNLEKLEKIITIDLLKL